MHFQNNFPQAKLVRVLSGEVYDVAVDLRPDSATFGKWFGVTLSKENHKMFFIPRGFAHGFLVLFAPFAIIAAYAFLRRVPGIGLAIDRAALAVPIFGKVGRFSANALFNHTMAMLVKSGISVVDALDLIRGTLANGWYRLQLAHTRTKVRAGRMFSDSLNETALWKLTPLTAALVKVGENSGNMDEGLDYVGEYYGDALERRLDLLGKLIEPALIVVVGGMVAYVYIAFFMGMAAMSAAAR